MTRAPFMTSEWLEAVETQLGELLAGRDLEGVSYGVCEEVTDAPDDRLPAWHFRIEDGRLAVGAGVDPGADLHMVVDYATHYDLARRVWDGNETARAQSARDVRAAIERGAMRVDGQLAAAPAVVRETVLALHDRVARLTV